MTTVIQFSTPQALLDGLKQAVKQPAFVYIDSAVLTAGSHGFERQTWLVCARCEIAAGVIWSLTIAIGQQQVLVGRTDEEEHNALTEKGERYEAHLRDLIQQQKKVKIIKGLLHLPGIDEPLYGTLEVG